jgi:hypothetical protein
MIVGYSVIFRDNNKIDEKITEIYSWNEAIEKAKEKVDIKNKNYDEELRIISLIKSNSEEICKQTGETIVYKLYQKGYGELGYIYIIAVKEDIIKWMEKLQIKS